ncbi:DMT family transporter [Algihabitans sp.]|uniref:DMT family transporter n=1 Tax=Algihabitans sp. TaxID=2821514 RepID=UPI003BA9748A
MPSAVSPAVSSRTGFGIGMMLLGMVGMVAMDACAKWLSGAYPINQIVFFRMAFGLLPALVLVWAEGGWPSLRSGNLKMQALRALAGAGAIFAFFTSLRYLGLAEATAIAFVAPLVVTALSVPLLGESVGWRRWTAVTVGFVGAMIILRPGSEAFQWAAILPLAAGVCYALALITTRVLARTDANAAIVFWNALIIAVAAGLSLPFAWVTPSWGDLGLFALMGLLGGVSIYWITLAFRNAPAAVLAPFDYSALLWSTLIGWLIWRELPDAWVWAGAVLLIGSGLYVLYRETRAKTA